MLSGAPPMLVVGLALHALWVPLSALLRLSDDSLALSIASMSFVLYFVGLVMTVAGELELARRTRGRVRAGMVIAMVADGFVLAIMLIVTVEPRWVYEHGTIFDVYRWGDPLAGLVMAFGFAVAAGRRHLAVSIAMFVVMAVIFPIPPLASFVFEHVGLGSNATIVFGALMGLRTFGFVRLGAAVAKAASPVRRDHLRAARGFRWAAVASGLSAVAAIAVLGLTVANVELSSKPAMVVFAIGMIAIVAMLKACWGIAEAQLETLSRYLGHVALAVAIGTVLAAAYVVKGLYEVPNLGDDLDFRLPSWVQLGSALTTAWLIVVLGRYARRARSLVRITAMSGGVFTIVSCVGISLRTAPVVFALTMIVANVAMIPLFVKASREVANDPVKTTADVFA